MKKIKVAVNGYGVIRKRIAEAIVLQTDMELTGIELDMNTSIFQTNQSLGIHQDFLMKSVAAETF